jgi:hypothetical protein
MWFLANQVLPIRAPTRENSPAENRSLRIIILKDIQAMMAIYFCRPAPYSELL